MEHKHAHLLRAAADDVDARFTHDLVIKQHEADNPVIITDNTQLIANMENMIAELVRRFTECADALEVAYNYCPNNESFDYIGYILADIKAVDALTHIRGEVKE